MVRNVGVKSFSVRKRTLCRNRCFNAPNVLSDYTHCVRHRKRHGTIRARSLSFFFVRVWIPIYPQKQNGRRAQSTYSTISSSSLNHVNIACSVVAASRTISLPILASISSGYTMNSNSLPVSGEPEINTIICKYVENG